MFQNDLLPEQFTGNIKTVSRALFLLLPISLFKLVPKFDECQSVILASVS